MFQFLFEKRMPEPGPALTETQRTLVEKKFELLQRASGDSTQDRLLHLQGEDLTMWTDTCTAELRSKITSVAAPHAEISLIDFPKLRGLSLQCLPLQ